MEILNKYLQKINSHQKNIFYTVLFISILIGVFHTYVSAQYFLSNFKNGSLSNIKIGPHFSTLWLKHLPHLFFGLIFFMSLPGLGQWVLKNLKISYNDHLINTGIGLLLWSLIGFMMAFSKTSTPHLLKVGSILLIAIGIFNYSRNIKEFLLSIKIKKQPPLAYGLVGVLLFYLITTIVPEVFYDALVYHLAVPHSYLLAGQLFNFPEIHLTHLPGFIQTIFLWGLSWGDDRICKVMNVGFGALISLTIIQFFYEKDKKYSYGLWAAFLFLTSPLIGVNVWSCTNDILCGFFFILATKIWVEKKTSSYPFLSGLFLGAALCTKYTAAFGLPFFLVGLGIDLKRKTISPKQGILFFISITIPLLPWLMKTALWTGNPFYPQLTWGLGGDHPTFLSLLASWKKDASFTGPWLARLFVFIKESIWGIESGRFGFLGPALLSLFLFIPFWKPKGKSIPLLYSAISSYLFFVILSGRLRYFIPQLSIFFILGVLILRSIEIKISSQRATLLKGWLILLSLINIFWMGMVFSRFIEGTKILFGKETIKTFLESEHIGTYGHPSQGAFSFLENKQAQGKLFIIGEARTYRSPLRTRASSAFNAPAYARWLNKNPSPDRFIDRLKKEGYTYLLVNLTEMRRITPTPFKNDFYINTLGVVFEKIGPPIYNDSWTVLFRVPKEMKDS